MVVIIQRIFQTIYGAISRISLRRFGLGNVVGPPQCPDFDNGNRLYEEKAGWGGSILSLSL